MAGAAGGAPQIGGGYACLAQALRSSLIPYQVDHAASAGWGHPLRTSIRTPLPSLADRRRSLLFVSGVGVSSTRSP